KVRHADDIQQAHELQTAASKSRSLCFSILPLELEGTMNRRILVFVGLGLMAFLTATGQDASDPNLWLEEVTGEKALAWVKERNAESMAELTGSSAFQALNERLLKILDSDERIPMIAKAGDYYYNFWRDAKNKRGLWRRTTLEEYRKA